MIAGVPPDYFAATGQLWGNPLYDWQALKESGYAWWVARVRAMLRQVDVIRLDHFRGFESFWEVPAGATTAQGGRWVKGPADDLFEKLRQELGGLPLIAEDLGLGVLGLVGVAWSGGFAVGGRLGGRVPVEVHEVVGDAGFVGVRRVCGLGVRGRLCRRVPVEVHEVLGNAVLVRVHRVGGLGIGRRRGERNLG